MVIPYYQDDLATLYHGDCRDILPALPADSIDLVVTDPPYGVRWQSSHRQIAFELIAGDDSTDAAVAALPLILQVLRNRRHIYMFGRYDLSGQSIMGPVELIWDKGNIGMGNLALPWGPRHETIQFMVSVRQEKNRADGTGKLAARLRRGSVLRYMRPNATGVRRHPTEKPVALLRELIESSSCIGDIVLDPFAGSGSTLIAARLEGRRAMGIEIDEGYCELIAGRLRRCASLLERFNREAITL